MAPPSPLPSIPIPHISPPRYTYHPHPTHPTIHLRRALGPETKWSRQASPNRQLFLSGHISLPAPPPPSTHPPTITTAPSFFAAAHKAWLRLRFLYPEIAQRYTGTYDPDDGSAVVQIEIPRDAAAAQEWVGRTLCIESSTNTGDGAVSDKRGKGSRETLVEDVETEMRKQALPPDPVSVRLRATESAPLPGGGGGGGPMMRGVTGAAFCMRVDHGLADGMGAYLLVGKFLELVAEEIGGRGKGGEEEVEEGERCDLDWNEATGRIPKPWVQMLNEEQRTEGEEFEKGVRANTRMVMESTKSRWGIKFRPSNGYEPQSMHSAFSPSQSAAILRSVKTHLGATYSITHLGHAAMILALLKRKPPQDRPLDQPHLVSPLFVNGRRYLDARQPKAKDHIPMCRAIGAIEFRDVERYICSEDDSEGEVRVKLKTACEEARRSYQRVRKQKSLLSESFGVAEVMATVKNDVKDKGMADPFFLSDGIIEQYTPRSYTDATHTREVLILDDIRFTANPDGPPVIIRMSTFRDAIRVSAEWNAALYADDEMRRFLDDVVGFVGSLTGGGEGTV